MINYDTPLHHLSSTFIERDGGQSIHLEVNRDHYFSCMFVQLVLVQEVGLRKVCPQILWPYSLSVKY